MLWCFSEMNRTVVMLPQQMMQKMKTNFAERKPNNCSDAEDGLQYLRQNQQAYCHKGWMVRF